MRENLCVPVSITVDLVVKVDLFLCEHQQASSDVCIYKIWKHLPLHLKAVLDSSNLREKSKIFKI